MSFSKTTISSSILSISFILAGIYNSFFTICFHTGFISLVLLLTPIKNIVKYFFIDSSKTQPDKNKVFLLLLLFSYMVWVSFNVVLELPHSAMLFWLVFFVSIEYFNSNRYLIK